MRLTKGIKHAKCLAGIQGGSVVKNLPAKQETWVQSMGQEDPLEKEMATQYSCLENPTDRGSSRLQSMGSQRVRHELATKQQQHPI